MSLCFPNLEQVVANLQTSTPDFETLNNTPRWQHCVEVELAKRYDGFLENCSLFSHCGSPVLVKWSSRNQDSVSRDAVRQDVMLRDKALSANELREALMELYEKATGFRKIFIVIKKVQISAQIKAAAFPQPPKPQALPHMKPVVETAQMQRVVPPPQSEAPKLEIPAAQPQHLINPRNYQSQTYPFHWPTTTYTPPYQIPFYGSGLPYPQPLHMPSAPIPQPSTSAQSHQVKKVDSPRPPTPGTPPPSPQTPTPPTPPPNSPSTQTAPKKGDRGTPDTISPPPPTSPINTTTPKNDTLPLEEQICQKKKVATVRPAPKRETSQSQATTTTTTITTTTSSPPSQNIVATIDLQDVVVLTDDGELVEVAEEEVVATTSPSTSSAVVTPPCPYKRGARNIGGFGAAVKRRKSYVKDPQCELCKQALRTNSYIKGTHDSTCQTVRKRFCIGCTIEKEQQVSTRYHSCGFSPDSQYTLFFSRVAGRKY